MGHPRPGVLRPYHDGMRYRYKKTGAVIEIASELHSPDWEAVPEDAAPASEKPSAKPGKKSRKAVTDDGSDVCDH